MTGRSTTPVAEPSAPYAPSLSVTALREMLETRLAAMDKATELLGENVTRVPTDTDKQISHLKELHDEKFKSIQVQFTERDVRSRASEDAAKVAVNAALQAQKEAAAAQNDSNAAAITKSEAATIKQIDGILALLASSTNAINDKIGAINARLDRGEGVSRGNSETTTVRRAELGSNVGLMGLGLAILTGLFGVISFLGRHQ